MVYSHHYGHKIHYNGEQWLYYDSNKCVEGSLPTFIRCGKEPTPEGYDACIGYIEGATSACCGHGITDGFVIFEED